MFGTLFGKTKGTRRENGARRQERYPGPFGAAARRDAERGPDRAKLYTPRIWL